MKGKFSTAKIVLIVWLVFSALYIFGNEYSRLKNVVAASGYRSGLADAVVEVIKQAQECKAFPVTFEGQGVNLVNVDCLTQPEEGVGEQPAQ